MDLSITGTVTQVLEEQSGESKNGPWRKQDFILETEGQYSRPVCITHWGEKIEEFGIREGETLTVYIDIQSREYKGRWYTDVKAWRVEREQEGAPGPGAGRPDGGPFPDEEPLPSEGSGPRDPDDDLPF